MTILEHFCNNERNTSNYL